MFLLLLSLPRMQLTLQSSSQTEAEMRQRTARPFSGKLRSSSMVSSSALVLSSRTLWSSLQEAALPSLERRRPWTLCSRTGSTPPPRGPLSTPTTTAPPSILTVASFDCTSLFRLLIFINRLPWYIRKFPSQDDLRWEHGWECKNSWKSWRSPTQGGGESVDPWWSDGNGGVEQLPRWISISIMLSSSFNGSIVIKLLKIFDIS